MAIIKCKMCGGDLEVASGVTVAECEYCGTKQTLPKANEEVIQNLFNRANALRLKCEFDKAEQIYEKILQVNDNESEAHWGIVLCKYGIEYVEDPKTYTRIPTCHRTSYDAVTADADYLAAIAHADISQRSIYEAEAKAIDEIQKNILSIVKDEKPFDVFLCYKETDEKGKRTVDSAIANEIYYQLTQEGLKVFYAAITLEDKLGREYEPYIFAALNSAKVMLVIGTKPQYFSSVWVKNEWSRFLKRMKTDRSKLLIPCYKDMDAYELPDEFAHLQAQDMSKIGFINDVVRGIRKVTAPDAPKETEAPEPVVTVGNGNITPILKRAFIFLEDGEWNAADEYCEKVLDVDPECAEAYLVKLMVQLRVRNREDLKDQAQPFDNNGNYQRVLRFADEKLRSVLSGYIDHIQTRNKNARLEEIYTRAKNLMSDGSEAACREAAYLLGEIRDYKDAAILAEKCKELAATARLYSIYIRAKAAMIAAKTEAAYKEAARLFESINEYQDSAALAQECHEKAEGARKDEILNSAKAKTNSLFIFEYETAIKLFESIPGWKDADEQIIICQQRINQINRQKLEDERQAALAREEAERIRIRNLKITAFVLAVACVLVAFIIILNTVIIPNSKYNDAVALMEEGNYTEAISVFEALGGYKDSAIKVYECKYNHALALMDEGKYLEAVSVFEQLNGYKDSTEKVAECNAAILNGKYNAAIALMEEGKYAEAISAFEALGGYKDSAEKANSIYYKHKLEKLKVAKVGAYVFFGTYEQDNNFSNGKEDIEWLVLEMKDGKALVVSKYALDCKHYNTSYADVTWETCSLRQWLNSDFMNTAFSTIEKAMISTVTVSADKDPNYSTNPGNATQDQVFLLSLAEAKEYFSSDSARQCKPTVYAVANGAYANKVNGNCWWWLRSPGGKQNYATSVYNDGEVDAIGTYVIYDRCAVRPAMWIDLSSLS